MPGARGSKRTLEEILQAEDSQDEDYDDRAPGPARPSKPRRQGGGGGHVSKKRRKHKGSDIDSDDEEVLSDDSYDSEPSEEEMVETNDNGRPLRRAAKIVGPKYADPSDSEVEEVQEDEDEDIEDSEEDVKYRRGAKARAKTSTPTKKSLIVKLHLTPQQVGRSLRQRSGSYSTKQPATSSTANPRATRRSSRLSHEPEELVGLTNSGRHTEIVREGSRDPETIPTRATRGGKGLKHPSKSTIDEESEPQSQQPKEEDEEAEPEIQASQNEYLHDEPHNMQDEPDTEMPQIFSDIREAAAVPDNESDGEFDPNPTTEKGLVEEPEAAAEDEEDEDEVRPNRGRLTRGSSKREANSPADEPQPKILRALRQRDKASTSRRRRTADESSDFNPEEDQANAEEMSSSSEEDESPRKRPSAHDYDESDSQARRSRRLRSQAASRQRSPEASEGELAEELAELKRGSRRPRSRLQEEIVYEPRGRRGGKKPDYNLFKGLAQFDEEEDAAPAAASPSGRGRRTGGTAAWHRPLLNVYGPFGGGGGPPPILGGGPQRAQGGVDSDSSDDEGTRVPRNIGGTVGMTPTTAGPINLFPQTFNADPQQAAAGTPANLGKLKDKQALADADPLGVDQNVTFDNVGGLKGHIDQLKEMVALPLLYPEIFMRFKITPPRGVLFHGPPGTGKTLLARALATSVSSQGKKVTFYMRKGADALSKWVGEAERQLRLLFEEARKNQPSIIFFDEIDGLAPVRSSKQEQIHASIVSTLLALMDGMDGRGQVIVIGATNRPDSIDPALRRPGRFDREFYFPLPGTEARRSIIDIHTKGWDPPLPDEIKDELAKLTKGYGGADLRALCVEAALNAVQRRYPQIYASNEKLVINPKEIEVLPKDFMISIKKMTPSSERSASSGASPLPPSVAPLLQSQLDRIRDLLADVLPQKKKLTALEEAQFEDTSDGLSFGRERMQQEFETSRVFRPRLLIQGKQGMGQQYVAAALLNHFEGLHVQSFDIPTLYSDTTSSPEATIIRLFSEVKMHKPAVIYLPNVQDWFSILGENVITTFVGLLRSIKPTDPVLLLGFSEGEEDDVNENLRRDLFGYSQKNQFQLQAPVNAGRFEFFRHIKTYISTAPDNFPDPENRKKREVEKLAVAPPEPEDEKAPLSKEELKLQKKRDRQTLNLLKIRLQPIMDQIRTKYKKFRTGVIDESQFRYLLEDADPATVTSDLQIAELQRATYRPYEIGKDAHGIQGLVDQANQKFYYNLDSVTIEKRLSNGFYKRPKDFLADIKRLAKDAKAIGDEERLLKANELLSNVEVDISTMELTEPAFTAECERVYQRDLEREKDALEKAKQAQMPPPQSNMVTTAGTSATDSSGPILLGEPIQRKHDLVQHLAPTAQEANSSESIMTNGVHPSADEWQPLTNGSSSGHKADVEDVEMEGDNSHPTSNEKSNETQPTHTTSSHGARGSAQPRGWQDYTAPSQAFLKQHGLSEPPSQTGAFTPMPPGSQPGEFLNDASTTESPSDANKKTTPSQHTQAEGQHESGPDLYPFEERRSAGGSQIPSTQGMCSPLLILSGGRSFPPQTVAPFSTLTMRELSKLTASPSDQYSPPTAAAVGAARPGSSQGQAPDFNSQHSATMPPPVDTRAQHRLSNASRIDDLLNPSNSPQDRPGPVTTTTASTKPLAPHANLLLPTATALNALHQEITDQTSGLSVEQLEQVNSVLMDTLWKTRGEWDRERVLGMVAEAFNQGLRDMQSVGQDFGSGSWGWKGRQ
jgi:ATPase family AAA domain-containing protein 2